jgi:hypothetical protein
MSYTLEIDHALTSEKTEKLEDEIKELIQEKFNHRMKIRSEKTMNELTVNPGDPGVE